jgi:DNA-binding transcriptional MerR regulator
MARLDAPTEAALDKAPDAFRIISEVADDLDVPQHVLRFWESRFTQIRPMKRGGGRRYYRPEDVDLLRGIRHLLYGEGYTIRGVQRILREQGVQFVQAVWREGAPQPPRMASEEDDSAERARGLLNLIPGFRKPSAEPDDVDGADEIDDDAGARVPPPPPMRGLGRDQLLQLQMALDGLGECRRLLDAALKEA